MHRKILVFVVVVGLVAVPVAAASGDTLSLFESGFEDGSFHPEWSAENAEVTDDEPISGSYSARTVGPHSGSQIIMDDGVDTTYAESVIVEYTIREGTPSSGPDEGDDEDIFVEYRSENGDWVQIARFNATKDNGDIYNGNDTIGESNAFYSEFYIRFRMPTGGGNDAWYVDDVSISIVESVAEPGTVDGELELTEFELTTSLSGLTYLRTDAETNVSMSLHHFSSTDIAFYLNRTSGENDTTVYARADAFQESFGSTGLVGMKVSIDGKDVPYELVEHDGNEWIGFNTNNLNEGRLVRLYTVGSSAADDEVGSFVPWIIVGCILLLVVGTVVFGIQHKGRNDWMD